MRKLIFLLGLAAAVAFGGGCAGKINSNKIPPSEYDVQETKIYNKPYDSVWKAVVQSIGSSYFVLENIEKDSGILSLSFSAQTPDDIIDCGMIEETGTVYMKKYELKYKGTANNITKTVLTDNGLTGTALRKFSVSGKSNILVKSVGSKSTQVTVKTRYVVELKYNVLLQGALAPIQTHNSMQFTGKEIGTFNVPGSMTCRSKGTLERSIFDGIEKSL